MDTVLLIEGKDFSHFPGWSCVLCDEYDPWLDGELCFTVLSYIHLVPAYCKFADILTCSKQTEFSWDGLTAGIHWNSLCVIIFVISSIHSCITKRVAVATVVNKETKNKQQHATEDAVLVGRWLI